MKAPRYSLLLGALVLAAAVQPQTARAQGDEFCVVFLTSGFSIWGTMDHSTNIFHGDGDTGAPFIWAASGSRGIASGERRHFSFTAANPNMADDPGCTDGTGFWVDWATYNGRIVSNTDGAYTYDASWRNSCGFEGVTKGIITPGGCPEQREVVTPAPGSGDMGPMAVGDAGADVAAADARTALGGFALTSAPNPSDGGTVISYTLPEATPVRLAVYDVRGREVAVLVDGARGAGRHEVVLDGAALPGGTYLVRLAAGGAVETQRLTLVR